MPDIEAAKTAAQEAIDAVSKELRGISLSIHGKPELNFEEHHASALLAGYLEQKGFQVRSGAYEMATAFEAVAGSGSPTIAVMCEYDALPGIGHACGHNLIAISGVAAGLALKAALGEGNGTVVVLGSPAEEGGGGKVFMIERGAFEGVDAAMMLHPAPVDRVWIQAAALHTLQVEFHGKNAHAGFSPWEGVNALDAMVLAFNAISLMRQQMRPTDRVHGVITDGGVKPNIIPDHTAAEFYVRALNSRQLEDLKTKAVACFEGAAAATGCTLDRRWVGRLYEDVVTNDAMAEAYAANFAVVGGVMEPKSAASAGGGSTDMGNVSYTVPSIHPMFGIPTVAGAANHTPGFTACAATEEAHANTIRAAKALALTGIDLYLRPGLLEQAKSEFAEVTRGENDGAERLTA
ncbi:MAG: M20 family metallopeptidase [Tepidiformaceae bacterium]